MLLHKNLKIGIFLHTFIHKPTYHVQFNTT